MFDITQFRADILTPTLEALQFREIELKELLVFTCAVESAGGTYVKQVKGHLLWASFSWSLIHLLIYGIITYSESPILSIFSPSISVCIDCQTRSK